MNQKNEDAQVIAAECIRQSEEGNYERALFRRAGELIQQLLAELEAVGAGGVQPLRAEAGWVLVPVEPTKEMVDAGADGAACWGAVWMSERTAATVYKNMLAAAPKAPQQPVPPQGTPAPQQEKPKLRVGQVWRTRDGKNAKIKSGTASRLFPFLCVSDDYYPWTVTEDGMYWGIDASFGQDLIELISDVPQEGSEA